jgi:transcription termination/antitermination protein NusA
MMDTSDEPNEPGADTALVTFTVAGRSEDVYHGTLADGRAAVLPFTELHPSQVVSEGSSVLAIEAFPGERPVLSAVRSELVAALYAGVAPEVRNGDVRIMAVARMAGVRSKVAVAATRDGIDPVAACVGREANRVACVSRLLGGERIDVVAYHPDLAVFAGNALAPAQVSSVSVGDESIEVSVPAHQMPAAVGGGGLNSHLAGELLGRPIDVVQAGAPRRDT